VQVVLRDPPGGRGHGPQRPQRTPRHQPPEPDRDDRHQRERDTGLDQELVQLLVALVGGLLAQAVGLPLEPLGEQGVGDLGRPVAELELRRPICLRRDADDDPVVGRAADEQVGDREQRRARYEEQRSVEQREPQPHGASRHLRSEHELGESARHLLLPRRMPVRGNSGLTA
jgi:hypothetical protein